MLYWTLWRGPVMLPTVSVWYYVSVQYSTTHNVSTHTEWVPFSSVPARPAVLTHPPVIVCVFVCPPHNPWPQAPATPSSERVQSSAGASSSICTQPQPKAQLGGLGYVQYVSLITLSWLRKHLTTLACAKISFIQLWFWVHVCTIQGF